MPPKKRQKRVEEPRENDEDVFWLIKSEPNSRLENGVEMKFSFDDLAEEENATAHWDGVRNYQARNNMMAMKRGQKAFFYHSNCKEPGIVGLVDIVKEAYPDHTQFDPKDPHYDPKSSKEKPKWFMVDVKYDRKLKRFVSLQELKRLHLEHKAKGGPLKGLSLFTSSRLSVQGLNREEFEFIVDLSETQEK